MRFAAGQTGGAFAAASSALPWQLPAAGFPADLARNQSSGASGGRPRSLLYRRSQEAISSFFFFIFFFVKGGGRRKSSTGVIRRYRARYSRLPHGCRVPVNAPPMCAAVVPINRREIVIAMGCFQSRPALSALWLLRPDMPVPRPSTVFLRERSQEIDAAVEKSAAFGNGSSPPPTDRVDEQRGN